MDGRDALTQRHFNQQIVFRPAGDTAFNGIVFDADLAARLTGALDGAIVTLDVDHEKQWAVFAVRHPLLAQEAQRIIATNPAGGRYLQNNDLRLNHTGGGLGARMLAHQVTAAHAIGLVGITLWAGAGVDEHNGLPLNGIYSWARCGFDAALPYTYDQAARYIHLFGNKIDDAVRARTAWLRAWPADLAGARRVRDVMETTAGRQWWKACPDGCSMAFDFAEPSCRQTLDAYLVEKGICIVPEAA